MLIECMPPRPFIHFVPSEMIFGGECRSPWSVHIRMRSHAVEVEGLEGVLVLAAVWSDADTDASSVCILSADFVRQRVS